MPTKLVARFFFHAPVSSQKSSVAIFSVHCVTSMSETRVVWDEMYLIVVDGRVAVACSCTVEHTLFLGELR